MIRFLILALFSTNVSAAGISLCSLCVGYTISKRADGAVIVRCPNRTTPLVTLLNCASPSVTRTSSSATITCR